MIGELIAGLRDLVQHHWFKFVPPLSVLAITLAAGLAIKSLAFRALHRWAGRVPTRARDILVETFRGVSTLWILILGLHLGLESSELPLRVTHYGARVLLILWVLSLTVVAARLAGNLVRYYGQQAGGGGLPVTTLTETLARLSVAVVGALILLNLLGVSITPLLTALGVGGLAVALALQDTLANLFAGFYMSLAGQVRPGDYIRLDGGQEGYVADVTWRSTTIRALNNNLIIIPNAKLAQSIVTNFHLPEKRMAISVAVSVGYGSDPDQVERVLLEEVRGAAGAVPGLRDDPAPSVRFTGFGESALNFSVNCHINEFVDQYLVQHELRKRFLLRLRKEGIDIPFPARDVYLRRPPEQD
jgi:small-conductance mechanosensitive channel